MICFISVSCNSAILSLSHREIENAIRLRYFKAGFQGRDTKMHQLLAGFYQLQADPHNIIISLSYNSAILSLSHREIENAIRLRYFKAGFVSRDAQMHQLLAGFYQLQADPNKNQTWKGTSAKAFAALPYHLVRENESIYEKKNRFSK